MGEIHIVVKALQCQLDEVPLFDPVSFRVSNGHLLLIVGRNGVGKSTLLRVMVGLWSDYLGEVDVRLCSDDALSDVDTELVCIRDYVHWFSHADGVDNVLSGYENLHYYYHMKGMMPDVGRIQQALDCAQLTSVAAQAVGYYSAGQRQRLKLCRLLLLSKPVWVLDEPFTALDSVGVTWLEQLMASHCESGGLVMMTSHQALKMQRTLQHIELTSSRHQKEGVDGG